MMINRKEDNSDNEEIFGGVCMEVAGIESCGFGVGPMRIQSNDDDNEK